MKILLKTSNKKNKKRRNKRPNKINKRKLERKNNDPNLIMYIFIVLKSLFYLF
jgi:hypothetical protein